MVHVLIDGKMPVLGSDPAQIAVIAGVSGTAWTSSRSFPFSDGAVLPVIFRVHGPSGNGPSSSGWQSFCSLFLIDMPRSATFFLYMTSFCGTGDGLRPDVAANHTPAQLVTAASVFPAFGFWQPLNGEVDEHAHPVADLFKKQRDA